MSRYSAAGKLTQVLLNRKPTCFRYVIVTSDQSRHYTRGGEGYYFALKITASEVGEEELAPKKSYGRLHSTGAIGVKQHFNMLCVMLLERG